MTKRKKMTQLNEQTVVYMLWTHSTDKNIQCNHFFFFSRERVLYNFSFFPPPPHSCTRERVLYNLSPPPIATFFILKINFDYWVVNIIRSMFYLLMISKVVYKGACIEFEYISRLFIYIYIYIYTVCVLYIANK